MTAHATRAPDPDCERCEGKGWRLVSFLAVCSCTRPRRTPPAPAKQEPAAAAGMPDVSASRPAGEVLRQIAELAEDHILNVHSEWCEDAARRLSAIYKLATGAGDE